MFLGSTKLVMHVLILRLELEETTRKGLHLC